MIVKNKIGEWEFRIRVVNGMEAMRNEGDSGGVEVDGGDIEGRS